MAKKRPAKPAEQDIEKQKTIPGLPEPTAELLAKAEDYSSKLSRRQALQKMEGTLKTEIALMMKQEKIRKFTLANGRTVELKKRQVEDEIAQLGPDPTNESKKPKDK